MKLSYRYLEFALIIVYMIITYHIIALKYRKSQVFAGFNRISKILLVLLHLFIVISNIFLYLWAISLDFNPVNVIFMASGILMFATGLFMIFWGIYALGKAVFVPGNRLTAEGPFAIARHPMYLGGIIGAVGLAIFAGSLLGLIYSVILALVLSRIADAEEEDLQARFGLEYIEYKKRVPKLFPIKGDIPLR
ncbi:MAG TPA: isoprenylcysteine carboxylmethyltransferase family protein [Candidatus Methanoperedens sp.]